MEIKRIADKVGLACEELVEWESELRSTIPPDSYLSLKQVTAGWATQVLRAIEPLPTQLRELLNQPILHGQNKVTLVLPVLNIDALTAEIARLQKHPPER